MSEQHDRVAAAVFAEVAGDLRVLVVHDRDGRWVLPKGRVDEGESAVEAAGREAHEEGGVLAVVDAATTAIWRHRTRRGRRQRVHVYAGRAAGIAADHPEPWRRPTWVAIGRLAALAGDDHYRRLHAVVAELAPAAARALDADEMSIA